MLGATNLELLVWLCGKVQPQSLASGGSSNAQIILASLVQQVRRARRLPPAQSAACSPTLQACASARVDAALL